MIPLDNLLHSVYRSNKYKSVYHYHGENLKIHVPSIIKYIDNFLNKDSVDGLSNILVESCKITASD